MRYLFAVTLYFVICYNFQYISSIGTPPKPPDAGTLSVSDIELEALKKMEEEELDDSAMDDAKGMGIHSDDDSDSNEDGYASSDSEEDTKYVMDSCFCSKFKFVICIRYGIMFKDEVSVGPNLRSAVSSPLHLQRLHEGPEDIPMQSEEARLSFGLWVHPEIKGESIRYPLGNEDDDF